MEEELQSAPPAMPETSLSKAEKDWAMFTNLSVFAGLIIPVGNIVGPLVMWQIKKDEFPFATLEAKELLNFQISVTIYLVISFFLAFVVIGFSTGLTVLVMALIFTILGCIKAGEGHHYRYPFTIRFIK